MHHPAIASLAQRKLSLGGLYRPRLSLGGFSIGVCFLGACLSLVPAGSLRAAEFIAFDALYKSFGVRGLEFADRVLLLKGQEVVIHGYMAPPLKPESSTITPSHAVAGRPFGMGDAEEEARHRHEAVHYAVVGRLPRLGTPWDRAILVPVESVWETHHLGGGHARQGAIGPPFDAAEVPGAPAIVVKPRQVSDAYALRAAYRRGFTMALFPAEVLVSLYRNIGDLRDILVAASALNNLLIFVAALLLLVTLAGLRRRRYAVLRALGAPASYIVVVIWAQAAILLGLGCLIGLPLGWGAAWLASHWFERQTGLHLAFTPGWTDALFIMVLLAAGSLLSIIPALLSYRLPVADGLQN